ncbi:T9SS type A sorting domain-containing protein [archaeon]|nr:T9SS type A sorting domain-containing protein [archaeon]
MSFYNGAGKVLSYAKEFTKSAIDSVSKSKPFQYAVLTIESIPLLAAINNSYAEDLKVTNKIRGTDQPVKYGKVYLMENSMKKDSLNLDINGAGVFRNLPTDVKKLEKLPDYFNISNLYPNPAKGSVSAEVEVPSSSVQSTVKCTIYDIKGSKVKDFETRHGPGVYRISWDGTSNRGEKAADGIYFFTAETSFGTKAAKFVYMKGSPGYGSNFSKIAESPHFQETSRGVMEKSTGTPKVYQLRFDNSGSTDPKIKSWTTDPFVFSTNKDTTVYSDKWLVTVSGIVKDAYADGPVGNAKVKVKYVNKNNADSTMTDAAGRYSISFDAAGSATNSFVVEASKPGWYSYREWPSTTASQLVDTLYTFEVFTETYPPAKDSVFMPWANRWIKTSKLKDGLEYIKYMHESADIRDINYTRIYHWRPQDLLLKTCMDTTARTEYIQNVKYNFVNPNATARQITRNAIAKSNSHFEKNKFVEVSNIQDSRLQIGYPSPLPSGRFDFKYDNDYFSVYPLNADIYLWTDSTGVVRFNEKIALHELGHMWWCSGTHSPFATHLISDYLGYGDFSDFEIRAITVLYNLPNTVTSSEPLAVKKYLLHKE